MVIEHIEKKYKNTTVLSDVSLYAKTGECIGLLGGNGSGKSTLLNILAGVLKCDKGSFTYNGNDLFANGGNIIGYVPQTTPLIDELTARDNLRLWYSREKMHREAENGVLKMLVISEFMNVPVHKMSGGMKKRLAIGCAVAENPKILLLDEPSAALDLACKEQISKYLEDFKAKGGIVILATHDVQELPLCDRLYILKNGKLTDFDFDGDIHRLAERL